MGREEQAKAERAKEREELKAAFLQEALGRLDSIEETLERQKKVVNQQGRALANVINAQRGELAALEIAVQPWYRRWAIAWWKYWLELLAVGRKAIEDAEQRSGRPSLRVERRIVEEDAAAESARLDRVELEQEAEIQARAAAGMVPPPAFDHIHQYVKDGPFVYLCTVEGCGRRADLQTISAEAEYLAIKGGSDANQPTTKLQG